MASLNLTDIKQAVQTAQTELTEISRELGRKDEEATKLRSRKTALEAFVNSAQGLLNASPNGQDISAIGGVVMRT
jgi:hypothetical protein